MEGEGGGERDIIGEFVDAENSQIARRHSKLYRLEQDLTPGPSTPVTRPLTPTSGREGADLEEELWAAASTGQADQVRLLLGLGADPNQQKRTGLLSTSTPLVVAACKGHTEVVAALLDHPATLINRAVSGGWTALMWAAWYGHCSVLEQLIAAPGLEVDQLNQAGKAAVMYGAEAGRAEACRLLVEVADRQVEAGEEDRVVRRSRLDRLLDQAGRAGCDVALAKMVLAIREMTACMKVTSLEVVA
jgi:hypothetical protein